MDRHDIRPVIAAARQVAETYAAKDLNNFAFG